MERIEAVRRAKAVVEEVFADEGSEQVGLEEINFDPDHDEWLITIGFAHRRRNLATGTPTSLDAR